MIIMFNATLITEGVMITVNILKLGIVLEMHVRL